jgi:pimeloyl-ACP methyl ester carboxylesterase
MALVAPLLDRNFSVVTFDMPAHGKSTGWTTNLIECANALKQVASLFSNVHGIVAHSFGGPVTALALAGLSANEAVFDVGRIALLAAPNESAYVTRRFGDELGLGVQAQSDFESAFEAACDCSLSDFTGSKYFARIDRPLLVLHGEDDVEVPVDHGQHYGELAHCQFVCFEQIGHRDILYAPAVRDHVARFMAA